MDCCGENIFWKQYLSRSRQHPEGAEELTRGELVLRDRQLDPLHSTYRSCPEGRSAKIKHVVLESPGSSRHGTRHSSDEMPDQA